MINKENTLKITKEFKELCSSRSLNEVINFLNNNKNKIVFIENIIEQGIGAACYQGRIDIIKYLFAFSEDTPDIHYLDDVFLAIASANNRIELVKFLLTSPNLKEHANLHAHNNRAFIWACEYGNLEIMDYLLHSSELKVHANINDISYYKQLAFLAACSEGKLEVLKYLKSQPELDFKLVSTHINGDNQNIFQLACENYATDTDIIDFLLVDCNYIPKKTDLEYIEENKNEKMVQHAQEIIKKINYKKNLDKSLLVKNQQVKNKRKI